MKTTLTIDNGNTRPSVGVFDTSGNLAHVHPLATFLSSCDIRQHSIALADVGTTIPQLEDHPKILRAGSLRKDDSFLGMPVHYSHTLGEDRLVAAWHIYREGLGRTILIDAGTFITIDLIDGDGFHGGYILPGPQTFLNSYRAGADLPKLSGEQLATTSTSAIPQNTPASLLTSCQIYLKATIQEILAALVPVTRLCLTGGDAAPLSPLLPRGMPLQHKPHLTHKALYEISNVYHSLASER